MKKLFFALLLLFAFETSFSQQEDSLMVNKIANEILANGECYERLQFLTKKIGGRLAGSPQMVLAEQWGEKVMKENGADKVWLQECLVPHWVRGGEDKCVETISGKKLDVVALGNSIGTGVNGIEGEVLLINSFDELEKRKIEINNKIVFYNYKFNPTLVQTFRSYGDASPYRGNGPSRAAKYGAKAVIVRSMSHSTDNNPHTGSTRYADSLPKIPAIAIGLKDADWLAKEIVSRTVNVNMNTMGHYLPDTIGHNVIGELIGSEFPDEIITIGGHLDSWDNCEGAHDDGAGCVQTMEILRAFKAIGYQPKRTIRFVLFANEENGLRGGTKYAEEAKAKNEKHVFALESDAGGFTPRAFGFTMSEEKFEKVLKWKNLIAPYGCSEFNRGGGGADIGPLNRIFNTPLAGLSPDSQRYFDLHHARNDVFENVNKRELELGAVNMAALIYLIDKYGL